MFPSTKEEKGGGGDKEEGGGGRGGGGREDKGGGEEEEDALPYYKTGAKSKHFSQLVAPLLVSWCVLTPNFWQQWQYIISINV